VTQVAVSPIAKIKKTIHKMTILKIYVIEARTIEVTVLKMMLFKLKVFKMEASKIEPLPIRLRLKETKYLTELLIIRIKMVSASV
jgi:hypothetical protein